MSNELVGAYWRLCSQMYSVGGPLKDDIDDICERLKTTPEAWIAIRDKLVAMGKLRKTRGGWINGRTADEIAKAAGRMAKAKMNGKEGGRPRKTTENSTDHDKNQPINSNDLQKPKALSDEKLSLTITTIHQPSDKIHDVGNARAKHIVVAEALFKIIGVSLDDPAWFGAMARVEMWLARGWDPEALIFPAARKMMLRRTGPPNNIAYVEQVVANYAAELSKPIATGVASHGPAARPTVADVARNGLDAILDNFARSPSPGQAGGMVDPRQLADGVIAANAGSGGFRGRKKTAPGR